MPSDALRNAVRGATGDAAPAERTASIDELLDSDEVRAELDDVFPRNVGLDVDRYIRVLKAVPLDDPMLTAVHPNELLRAYTRCAQLGLEPNSILGHAFLKSVPIPDTEQRAVEFIMGYKGMLALAHRSPSIESVSARVVRVGDDFEFDLGTDNMLMHSWDVDKPRGEPRCYYGMVRYPGGAEPKFEVISLEEIEEHKSFSATADQADSYWQTRPVQMALKTVIRIMFPMLPVEADALEAVNSDGALFGANAEDLAPAA